MKTALILYPHQLYPFDQLPQVDNILMVEEPLYFGVDQEFPLKLHKQKLIVRRASMRRYVEEVLWPNGVKVDYIELDVFMNSGDVLDRFKKYDQLQVFDPVNEVLAQRLLLARRQQDKMPTITFLSSPNFYLQDQEVRAFLQQSHKELFLEFYQWQRERFNVLIGSNYKPEGGAWMLGAAEADDKKLPADVRAAGFAVFGDNQWVADAVAYVEEHFPDNPGSTECIWPTSHQEAVTWLREFVDNRLDNYAAYPEAFDATLAWAFHSGLSPCLNNGLLSPQQVVDAALERHASKPVPLESLELFIRNILGRRELARGMYAVKHRESLNGPLQHKRRMTPEWFNGSLGIPPFDDLVVKVLHRAHANQSERNLVAGSLMLLAEIEPHEIAKWLGELFVDADDWNVTAAVYDMFHFAGAGSVSEKRLPFANSSYLLQVSHYERGEWSDVWDGLYWRFVEKNKTLLAHHPLGRVLTQRLHRLDADRRRIIHYRAEDFLNQFTRL